MQASKVDRFYERRADTLAPLYDSVAFADVHAGLLPFLPAPGARVLDVGSGSGRDAIALARMGYQVTAAEPSSSLRQYAIAQDRTGCVCWLDDRLPALASLAGQPNKFAVILCSGVLMHLSAPELISSIATLGALLRAEGRLALSLRPLHRSESRTLFHDHRPLSVISAGLRAGLSLVKSYESDDALGRTDRIWSTFVFAKEIYPIMD